MATLGLVLMVKDAGPSLAANLATIRPHISYWTVLDTGSTDGTQDVVREALAGIPGQLNEEPFVDFGTTRSRAFGLARGTADWLLASDADMRWEIDEGWEPGADVEALMVRMGGDAFEWRLPLVLRGDLPWVSIGVVHEFTALADGSIGRRAPTDAFRVAYPDGSSPAKTKRYAKLLDAALKKDPTNPRTVFYAAQTHRELGHLDKARRLYQQRATMGGYEEERWYAIYRAALLEPWSAERLMGAWEQRPHRLEPLYALLRGLNERSCHQAAYRLARVTAPASTDGLFVEGWIWDWGIAFERSIACWWAGPREEFEALTAQLLANPRLPAEIRAQVESNAALEVAS